MRISIATAKELVNNYRQNHWPVINGGCPSLMANPFFPLVQDSRSVWFSLADIQAFIQASGNQADGIRIYFGEYSADIVQAMIDQLDPKDPNYQDEVKYLKQCTGLHTLLFIPTKLNDTTGISHDYNLITGTTNFSTETDMAAEDHGTLNPPPFAVAGVPPTNVGQDFMIYCDTHP
jgi:hypothetical protein